jgi:hypothetical protein
MEGRLFILFALTASLALLMAWTTAAGGTDGAADIQPAPSAVSFDGDELRTNEHNAGLLSYTSSMTFTPAFTTYLSAVFKGSGGCSAAPTLLSPADGSGLSTIAPLFQWDNGSHPAATGFRLHLSKDPEFKQGVWSVRGSSKLSEFRFAVNLEPAATYYWRAWLTCGETKGPYSAVWSFITGSGGTLLPGPALTAPPDGTTVPSPTVTMQWSPVSGALEYVLHYRRAGDQGQSTSWVADTQAEIWLYNDTTYEWWVSARDEYGIGADSGVWEFTTPAGVRSVPRPALERTPAQEDSPSVTFLSLAADALSPPMKWSGQTPPVCAIRTWAGPE